MRKLYLSLVCALFFMCAPQSVRADISTGLMLWWKFDEGSGTSAADSAGSNTGTLSGGPPTWVAGKVGSSALNFNGSNDVVTDGTNTAFNFAGGNSFSIAAWVKPASISGFLTLVSREDGSGGWVLYNSGTGGGGDHLTFTKIGVTDIDLGFALSSGGTWQHVVLTYAAGAWVLYVDNTPRGSGTENSSINSAAAASLRTGATTFGENYFGQLDEVRIYNRALSSGDVTELFNFTGGGGATCARNLSTLGVGC
jgi:hypothetical protein